MNLTLNNKQEELFGNFLNPVSQSKFNPKTLSTQGTLRYKKNDLLKHCFTGKFQDDEPSNKEMNINISTPMTQQENTGVLKLIKEMVFSDLLKLAKNVGNSNENNAFGHPKSSNQFSENTTGYSKITSIRPQMLKNGNICFADDLEADIINETDDSIIEDYCCSSDEEEIKENIKENEQNKNQDEAKEVIKLGDIKFKLIDEDCLPSESKRINDILNEFNTLKTYISKTKSIKKEEVKSKQENNARCGTIISVKVESKNISSTNNQKDNLLAPIKIQNNELSITKHHSVDESGNKSPDTTKARKSKTQLPKNENCDGNKLIEEVKKKIYECSDHGKLIVLFAANLFCANQMVNCAQVIENIGLEYKNDKLTLANIYKLYSLYYFKDESIDEAVKQCDKAIKLFRSCKSIQGTALCYLLKAFLKLDIQPESSLCSFSDSDNEKQVMYTNELLEKFDLKIAQINEDAQCRSSYLKVRATICTINEESGLSTLNLVKSLVNFFAIPVFTTEDEKEEDFSPKAESRATVPIQRKTRLKSKPVEFTKRLNDLNIKEDEENSDSDSEWGIHLEKTKKNYNKNTSKLSKFNKKFSSSERSSISSSSKTLEKRSNDSKLEIQKQPTLPQISCESQSNSITKCKINEEISAELIKGEENENMPNSANFEQREKQTEENIAQPVQEPTSEVTPQLKRKLSKSKKKTVISKSKIKTKSDKKEKVMTRNLQKSKDKCKTQAKQKSKEIKGLNAIIDSTSLSSFELNRKEHQSEEKDNQEIENNSKNKDYDQTPKDSQQSSQKWSLSQKKNKLNKSKNVRSSFKNHNPFKGLDIKYNLDSKGATIKIKILNFASSTTHIKSKSPKKSKKAKISNKAIRRSCSTFKTSNPKSTPKSIPKSTSTKRQKSSRILSNPFPPSSPSIKSPIKIEKQLKLQKISTSINPNPPPSSLSKSQLKSQLYANTPKCISTKHP